MRHAPLRAGLTALALLALSACSDDGAPDSAATVTSGDPAACPGEVLDVVVSVAAWSDVVRRLGGDCATVTTIAASPADAPEDVVPADRAAFDVADLVVVNGARYDEWAVGAAAESDGDPVVVTAAEVAGSGAGRPDPQLWYEPEVVPEVAAAVTRELATLSPDAEPYFDAQHTAWTAELQPYVAAVAALRDGAAGRTCAATLTAWGPMARALGLTQETPSGFLRSLRSESEPSADDVDAFETALREGAVDVLVRDGAAGGGTADRLRDVAEDAGVPVVEFTEFPPEDGSFVEWQLTQLAALSEALADGG
ncbi:zinc/manganese transport system substrate-binding protein [Blastococcus aurantiacus]|uniref:Zinc/manganese transport system substrate-binding protein n=1 Tax=Blastococcus aurantiacus TaxID=1550231 RepID=A0A1G7NPG6_9ACTN|nr:zinc ABC transporter substrate-binding protein [Blastococcus aurantiacus]SDF75817.1 zinc/manganese transport system substrate-binding protein [Blastococcus aurantiacus]